MARLQILELPTEHHGDDMTTPYLLILDQADDQLTEDTTNWPEDMVKRTGARAILCFHSTIEIPANGTVANSDSHTVIVKAEGDSTTVREQVEQALRDTKAHVGAAR